MGASLPLYELTGASWQLGSQQLISSVLLKNQLGSCFQLQHRVGTEGPSLVSERWIEMIIMSLQGRARQL